MKVRILESFSARSRFRFRLAWLAAWCVCLLTLAIPSQGQPAGKCGKPSDHLEFNFDDGTAPAGCTYKIVLSRDEGVAEVFPFEIPVWEFHVQKYQVCNGKLTPVNGSSFFDYSVDAFQYLSKLCGEAWALTYYSQINGFLNGNAPIFQKPRTSARAASSGVTDGQAAQLLAVRDLNGDGLGDDIFLSGQGVNIQLRNSSGGVGPTQIYPLPFVPDLDDSSVVLADFNGDGRIDLAVSNPGTPGSDAGGIAILLGNGDGTFQAAKSFTGVTNPGTLAAADFNGDGKIDLAAASLASASIAVLPGKGDGTFGAAVTYPTGGVSSTRPASILALDVNGDGKPDLVAANRAPVTLSVNSLSVLLNTGASFRALSVISIPVRPDYLAFSDLNNDGNPDLLAVSQVHSGFVALTGNGDGTFSAPAAYATGNSPGSIVTEILSNGARMIIVPDQASGKLWFTLVTATGAIGAPPLNFVGGAPTGIASGDLDGDGLPDAVVIGGSSDVGVLLNQTNGALKAPVGYSLGLSSTMPQAVAVGDIDGDGKPDVAVVSAGTGTTPGQLSVLLNSGNGTLRLPRTQQLLPGSQSIALADLDKDGKLDAAVAAAGQLFDSSNTGAVLALLGRGDGTFQQSASLTVAGYHPEAVAIGDVNGDGIPDLAAVEATALSGPVQLAIFIGKGGGQYQAAQTFAVKPSAGTQSGLVLADFNGDGKLDAAVVSNGTTRFVDVLLGDGTGSFHEAASIPSSYEDLPVSLTAVDVDGDGHKDLIVSHCCGQEDATYFAGNGDGTFQAEQPLDSGQSPMGVAAVAGSGRTLLFFADNQGTVVANSIITSSSSVTAPLVADNVNSADPTLEAVAPGAIGTAFGVNLATGVAIPPPATTPNALLGTTVNIRDSAGVNHAGGLYYVSPTQVNYTIPDNTATGIATISINTPSGLSASIATPVTNVAAAVYELNLSGLAAALVLRVAADSTQSIANVYQVDASNNITSLPIDLSAGQVYLELYGTGIRNAKSVTVTLGGQNMPIYSWGPQGQYPGMDQVNVGPLPASLQGAGKVNLVLNADGQIATTLNLTFK